MKKIIFVFLFSIILLGVYGQQRSENIWLIGKWSGTNISGEIAEFIFNDNGTGRIDIGDEILDFFFSINENLITLFIREGNGIGNVDITVFRISDQRLVLRSGRDLLELNKGNIK